MFQRSRQGAVNVLSSDTPLTGETADGLTAALQECFGDGQPRAVLDLHNVPLLDSRGLESLLDAQENFELRAGALKLAAASPLCLDILKVTGVANHFEIFPEVKTAVASFLQ